MGYNTWIFAHGVSGLLHLVLLLFVFVLWGVRGVSDCSVEESNARFKRRRVVLYKQTLLCCLGSTAFYLVFCLLSSFCWYKNDWDNLVILSDLVLKTLAWGAISVSLHSRFSYSGV